MALVIADRVKETSTTTGTGTITLGGAVTGYQAFSVLGNGNQCYYTIVGTAVSSEWEVGVGTYSSSTLTRDTVLDSSTGGAKISFSAGNKEVFVTYPADKAITSDILLLDIGTDPNEIPLNQFLGTMAYQDSIAVAITGGTLTNVTSSGYSIQPAVTAITTAGSTTLTVEQIQTLIATVTQTAAVTLVLPTGTLTDAGVLNGLSAVGTALRWTVINLGSASGAVTMSGGTGHTYVGNATVAIATSARFKTVKTATNTFVTYRIA
jgi:hypothetical protein